MFLPTKNAATNSIYIYPAFTSRIVFTHKYAGTNSNIYQIVGLKILCLPTNMLALTAHTSDSIERYKLCLPTNMLALTASSE
jgi:hypothetical protein